MRTEGLMIVFCGVMTLHALAEPPESKAAFEATIRAQGAGDLPLAITNCERWLHILEQLKAPDGRMAQATFLLGSLYLEVNNIPAADAQLRSTIARVAEIPQPSANDEKTAFLARAKLAGLLMERSPKEVRPLLERNDELVNKIGPFPLFEVNEYLWVRYWWNAVNVREAEKHLQRLRPYFGNLQNQNYGMFLMAGALDGSVAYVLHNDGFASQIADFLIAKIKNAGPPQITQGVPGIVDVVRLLTVLRKNDQAEDLIVQSLGQIKGNARIPKATVAGLKLNLAVILANSNRRPEAVNVLREAIASSNSNDSPIGYAQLLSSLGMMLVWEEGMDAAIPSWEKARQILLDTSSPELNTLVTVTGNLAQACYATGDREKALKYALESIAAEEDLFTDIRARMPFSDAAQSIAFLQRFSAADIIIDSGDAKAIAKLLAAKKGKMFSHVFARGGERRRRALEKELV